MLENIGNFILTCLCGSRKETNTYKKCENYSPKTSKSVGKM